MVLSASCELGGKDLCSVDADHTNGNACIGGHCSGVGDETVGTDGTLRNGGGAGAITETVSRSVTRRGSESFVPYSVKPGSPLVVALNCTGDSDLYVRFNGSLTTTAHNCRPQIWLSGATEICVLTLPSTATAQIARRQTRQLDEDRVLEPLGFPYHQHQHRRPRRAEHDEPASP